jgi:hypothetical protein
MVAVRLARGWIDYDGTVHQAGDLVEVDAVTLAKMEAAGVVTAPGDEPTMAWAGPTSDEDEPTMAWAGPTDADATDSAQDDDGSEPGDGGRG